MRRFTGVLTLLLFVACSSATDKTPGITTPTTPTLATTRTLIDGATIAASGGVLQYSKTGDALNGLTLTVPAGAYSSASTWTVVADSNVVVPLPTGFTQVGPALAISTNQSGYASDLITFKIPIVAGTGYTFVPFYFNPDTKQFEAIPTVGITPTSVTFATKNFSAALTATNGVSSTALRSAPDSPIVAQCEHGFGGVCVVVAKIPDALLQGSFASTFLPGRDDWEFVNWGDYASPGGDCEGMSITAMYFQYFVLASGGLYHKYDTSLTNQWDNVQGIRFAGSVQADAGVFAQNSAKQIARLDTLVGATIGNADPVRFLTSNWVLATLKLTGKPVLMALTNQTNGHAVVAYAASLSGSTTTVSFSDPNYPGTARTMKFEAGILAPITLQPNAAAAADSYTKAYALGVSAEVPIKSVDARYAEFKAKTAGSDRYPSDYSWMVYNFVTNQYDVMSDVVRTSDNQFFPTLFCPGCSARVPGNTPVYRQSVVVYDAAGQNIVPLIAEGDVILKPGTSTFVLEANPKSPFSPIQDNGFLDSRTVTVIYTPGSFALNVTTAPLNVIPGTSATDVVQVIRSGFVAGLPITAVSDAGITVTPSERVTFGDFTTLTVTVPNTVAVGSTHTVTVTGVGADIAPVVTTFAVVVVANPSYSLSVLTAPVNVTSGTTSFVDNVNITRTNYTGNITLSGSAPNGITVNITAQPGTGSTGAFTVTVPSGLAAGTYIATLTGTGIIASKTTTFAVVVTAPSTAGYSFAVSPDPLAVEINHAAYPWAVTLNRDAYSGAVTVSATTDDAGLLVTPSSSSNVNTNVALSVRATAVTSVGTHTITLKGVAAGRTDQVTAFTVATTLPAGGTPVGIVLSPAPVSLKSGVTQQFIAYLVDAQGNRTLPETGWRIGVATDNSNVGHDVTSPAFDTTQRWQTHDVDAVGAGTTSVRAFYEKIVGGQSTFVSIAVLTVTP